MKIRSNWREVILILFIVVFAIIYAFQSQRLEQWSRDTEWWVRLALSAQSDVVSAIQSNTGPQRVLNFRYDPRSLRPIATYNGIEYLGCDLVMDSAGEQRIVTFWRGAVASVADIAVRFAVETASGSVSTRNVMLVAENDWASASLPVESAVVQNGRVWVSLLASGQPLAVQSSVLTTRRGDEMLIWNRARLPVRHTELME